MQANLVGNGLVALDLPDRERVVWWGHRCVVGHHSADEQASVLLLLGGQPSMWQRWEFRYFKLIRFWIDIGLRGGVFLFLFLL